jgi:small-conductance mechanosensitive channel
MQEWPRIIEERLREWWVSFIHFLPNVMLAILVVAIAIFAGRVTRRLIAKIFSRFIRKVAVNNFISTIFQLIILLIGLFICLDILGLNKTVSSLLAGAGIIGIILGFALQDIISNFISGIYITFKKPFETGDTVKTNDFIGHVEDIQLRSTIIRTFSGLHLMIPNKEIIQKPLINYSLTPARRIELDFHILSGTDLEAAHRAAMDAINSLHYLYPGKNVEIYFNDLRFDVIRLSVWFWINNHEPPGYMVARHEAIFNILTRFRDTNIRLASSWNPNGPDPRLSDS